MIRGKRWILDVKLNHTFGASDTQIILNLSFSCCLFFSATARNPYNCFKTYWNKNEVSYSPLHSKKDLRNPRLSLNSAPRNHTSYNHIWLHFKYGDSRKKQSGTWQHFVCLFCCCFNLSSPDSQSDRYLFLIRSINYIWSDILKICSLKVSGSYHCCPNLCFKGNSCGRKKRRKKKYFVGSEQYCHDGS